MKPSIKPRSRICEMKALIGVRGPDEYKVIQLVEPPFVQRQAVERPHVAGEFFGTNGFPEVNHRCEQDAKGRGTNRRKACRQHDRTEHSGRWPMLAGDEKLVRGTRRLGCESSNGPSLLEQIFHTKIRQRTRAQLRQRPAGANCEHGKTTQAGLITRGDS